MKQKTGRLILLTAVIHVSCGCSTAPPATCYSGTAFANDQSGITFESCRDDCLKDWCSARYVHDSTPIVEYHCANAHPIEPFTMRCGEGASAINNGGCQRAVASNGQPCYYCCCQGTACNDPRTFLSEVSAYLEGGFLGSSSLADTKLNYLLPSCLLAAFGIAFGNVGRRTAGSDGDADCRDHCTVIDIFQTAFLLHFAGHATFVRAASKLCKVPEQ
ncbi:hypothetical protein Tcan_11691 [Toxocara canis]|uniref:Uncharacterized protein n=1 Tax=Toxocara canis TaxID=6265 RepID=A0A0B2V274_TOXCA|nr:hypothetical protein Tcan_11691 [Toxocara canis]